MFKILILVSSFFFLNAASAQDSIQCLRNPFYRCQLNDSSCTTLSESWKCIQAEVHAACVGTYSEKVESKLLQAEKKGARHKDFGERDIVHECIYKWYYDGLAQSDTMDGFCKFYKPLPNECDLKNRGPCDYMINMIKQTSKVLANVSCQNQTPAEICMAETENCSAELNVSTAKNCSAAVNVSTAENCSAEVNDSTVAAENSTVAAENSTVAAENSTVAAENSTVAAEISTVAAEISTVAAEISTIIAESSTVAAENSTTITENSRLLTTLIYYLLFISTLFTIFRFINLY